MNDLDKLISTTKSKDLLDLIFYKYKNDKNIKKEEEFVPRPVTTRKPDAKVV